MLAAVQWMLAEVLRMKGRGNGGITRWDKPVKPLGSPQKSTLHGEQGKNVNKNATLHNAFAVDLMHGKMTCVLYIMKHDHRANLDSLHTVRANNRGHQ